MKTVILAGGRQTHISEETDPFKLYDIKISDTTAACGLKQLENAEQFITARKDNYSFLKDCLKPREEFIQLPEPTEHSDPSWFGFPITIKKLVNKSTRSA